MKILLVSNIKHKFYLCIWLHQGNIIETGMIKNLSPNEGFLRYVTRILSSLVITHDKTCEKN